MENKTNSFKEMSIFEFSKLNNVDKTLYMFHFQATKLDSYFEDDTLVYVYFCANFFIEVKINNRTSFYEIIPFKRGFNLNKNVPVTPLKKEVITYGKAA
jgi:hypothetical protein